MRTKRGNGSMPKRQVKTRFRNRSKEAKGIPALAAYCDIRGEDKHVKPRKFKRTGRN